MTAEQSRIHGKVAKVFSNRQVALNVGKAHEVEVGMLFDIVVQHQHAIEDPDTGELLGNVSVTTPKARVSITNVYDKYSIATVYTSQASNAASGTPTLTGDRFTGLASSRTPTRSFSTKEGQSGGLDEDDRYVATGDPVVQVLPTNRDQ